MPKKILLCIIINTIIIINTYSQKNDSSNHYIDIGSSFVVSRLNDKSLSSLNYYGIGGLGAIGYTFSNKVMKIKLSAMSGYKFYNDNLSQISFEYRDIDIIDLKIDLDVLFRIKEFNPIGLELLTGTNINFDYILVDFTIFSNNKLNTSYILPFSWSNMLRYNFSLFNMDFKSSFKVDIPILTYNKRPRYSLPKWEDTDKGKRSISFLFSDYFFMFTTMNISYILTNNNQIQLYYKWDYINLDDINPIHYAKHLIGLNFKFSL